MNQTFNVLIIDDHQIIIDTYTNALNFISKNDTNVNFNISQALDCKIAHDRIVQASKKKDIDLVFLDIQLPTYTSNKLYSGESIGLVIKQHLPNAKIFICTSINDNYRLNKIFKTIKPEGFLIKSDIVFKDLVIAIQTVIANACFYSYTIIDLMRKRITDDMNLDDNDILLLRELSNGAKMKELMQLIPLTKSGIEKRKRLLKEKFKIANNSDRELVLAAKVKGYI